MGVRDETDHPELGGGGDASVPLEHPAVVGQEELETEAQGEDE